MITLRIFHRDDTFDFLTGPPTGPAVPSLVDDQQPVQPVFPSALPNKPPDSLTSRIGVKRKKKKHKSNEWRKQLNEKVAQVGTKNFVSRLPVNLTLEQR